MPAREDLDQLPGLLSKSGWRAAFGLEQEELFDTLDDWGDARGVEFVFRSHLNTRFAPPGEYDRIAFRPLRNYPVTEELLLVSDVLVSDWSSISTDFLVLRRPIVYLDVPPPFAHGFGNLDDGDRPGPFVGSMAELLDALDVVLAHPEEYAKRFGSECEAVLAKAFDDTLDGRCSQRHLAVVQDLVAGN